MMQKQNYSLPRFIGETGWEPIDDLSRIGGSREFMTGEDNAHVLRLCYFKRCADGALVGKLWFGPGAEGPPKHAHGGAIAAVFDEIMGAAAWLAGYPILAAGISVQFKKPVPLGVEVFYDAIVKKVEGRRVHVEGSIFASANNVFASGNGMFALIDPGKLGSMRERLEKIVKQAGITFK